MDLRLHKLRTKINFWQFSVFFRICMNVPGFQKKMEDISNWEIIRSNQPDLGGINSFLISVRSQDFYIFFFEFLDVTNHLEDNTKKVGKGDHLNTALRTGIFQIVCFTFPPRESSREMLWERDTEKLSLLTSQLFQDWGGEREQKVSNSMHGFSNDDMKNYLTHLNSPKHIKGSPNSFEVFLFLLTLIACSEKITPRQWMRAMKGEDSFDYINKVL